MSASLITQLYIGYYNRAPDPAGLSYWIDIAKTQSITQIAEFFSQQAESKAAYPYLSAPNVADPNAFVNQIYLNLFNRAATDADKAYWVGQLQSGKVSVGAFIATIQFSANSAGTGDDFNTLKNKATVGLDYATKLANTNTTFTQDSAKDVISGVTKDAATVTAGTAKTDAFVAGGGGAASTLSLTVNPDVLTGSVGNDTFNSVVVNNEAAAAATGSTLQVSDVLDGGNGLDTLNVLVTGANSTAALSQTVGSTKAIEVISVKNLSTGTAAGVTVNAGNATGVTTVKNDSSTAAVTVTGVTSNAAITTAGSAATTVVYADSVFASGGTLTLNLNGAGTSGTAANVTVGAAATAGTATALTINATGSNNVVLAAGGGANIAGANGIKTLTVTGSGSLNLGAASALVGTTLAADLTTLNASANSGGVTASVSNAAVKVTGGSGADVITLAGALGATANVSLGVGNDKLLNNGGSVVTGATIDGGDGTDTIAATLINAGNSTVFKNFEILGLDRTSGTLDTTLVSGVTGLELLAAGGTYTGVTQAQGLAVNTNVGGATTLTFAGVSGTSDAYTVTFGAPNASAATTINAGTLTANGIEILNLVSGGGNNISNQITVTDDALRTINITGAKDLSLAFNGTVGKSGGTSSNGDGLASIDGSAATGKLGIDLTGGTINLASAGLTVKGGSAADTITFSTSFAATASGGAGADTFVVSTVVGTTAAGGAKVTVTDFTTGDKITFANQGTEVFTSTKVNIGAAASLAAALDLASTDTGGGTNGQVKWFQYGSDTYVVQDNNNATTFTAGSDIVVKLTGLIDLSTATLGGTNGNVLTL